MQVDSLTTAQAVQVVSGFLSGVIPWLDPAVINWISHAAAAVPIVAFIVTWELVGGWLRNLSPALNEYVGKRLEKYSWLINPLLAAIAGQVSSGDSSMGLVAGAVWSMLRKIPVTRTTVAGLGKSKALALVVLAAGMVIAMPARAAESVTLQLDPGLTATAPVGRSITAWDRIAFGFGGGYRYKANPLDGRWAGFVGAQVGVQVWDHFGIRSGIRRDIGGSKDWDAEVGAWLMF